MNSIVNIKDLFLDLQETMQCELKTIRKNVKHSGSKGDATEVNWIDWLNKYLPNRYKVDKAFVVDCHGNRSDQLDIVIYDCQYSPFIFNNNGIIYIPAESVYAVFEVKQELSKEYLEYAADKIASVRNLHRTNAPIYHAGGTIGTPKTPFKILGGILTSESSWTPPFGEAFETCIKDINIDAAQFINIGCALSDGAFVVKYINDQSFISRSTRDEVLIFFFLNLFMELQKLGTVPAIEVSQYAKVLDSM